MRATQAAQATSWTIHSLRPPTLDDTPFDTKKTAMVAAGDMVAHPLPAPSPALNRAIKRFPNLSLEF